MEAYLMEIAKSTNSPTLIICGGLIGLVYFLIKDQRAKTAVKRDAEKKDMDVKIALLEKDNDNLKEQISILFNRWDTLQPLLNRINENLSAIRENISSLTSRIERIEREKDRND
jgi:septal ring factor EnvC (AmiA/AmiB activator)